MLAGSESRSLGVSVSEILQDCHSERSSLSRTESDPSADLALPGEPLTHTRYPTILTPPSKSLKLPEFICPFIETVPLSRFWGRDGDNVFYVMINPFYSMLTLRTCKSKEQAKLEQAKVEQANFSACLLELILCCVKPVSVC